MNAAPHPLSADEAPATITLTPKVAALLAIVAGHDRMTPEGFLAAAICRRFEEIGVASAVAWLASTEPRPADDPIDRTDMRAARRGASSPRSSVRETSS